MTVPECWLTFLEDRHLTKLEFSILCRLVIWHIDDNPIYDLVKAANFHNCTLSSMRGALEKLHDHKLLNVSEHPDGNEFRFVKFNEVDGDFNL
jgi:hypothetical protein